MTLDVTVDKAKVSLDDIEIPSDISVTAGSELFTVALPNYFKWDDSTMTVSAKAGTYKYTTQDSLFHASSRVLLQSDSAFHVPLYASSLGKRLRV